LPSLVPSEADDSVADASPGKAHVWIEEQCFRAGYSRTDREHVYTRQARTVSQASL